MKLIQRIKDLIKRIRRYFAVAFARRMYDRFKKRADELRKETNTHWHLVLDPFGGKELQIIDRKRFRKFKRDYQDVAIRTLVRRGAKYTVEVTTKMDDVKAGAFYSTSFTDRLDIEARRRAYIDWVVSLSEPKKE